MLLLELQMLTVVHLLTRTQTLTPEELPPPAPEQSSSSTHFSSKQELLELELLLLVKLEELLLLEVKDEELLLLEVKDEELLLLEVRVEELLSDVGDEEELVVVVDVDELQRLTVLHCEIVTHPEPPELAGHSTVSSHSSLKHELELVSPDEELELVSADVEGLLVKDEDETGNKTTGLLEEVGSQRQSRLEHGATDEVLVTNAPIAVLELLELVANVSACGLELLELLAPISVTGELAELESGSQRQSSRRSAAELVRVAATENDLV